MTFLLGIGALFFISSSVSIYYLSHHLLTFNAIQHPSSCIFNLNPPSSVHVFLNKYFLDIGSGTCSLAPLALAVGVTKYCGVEIDATTAARSIDLLSELCEPAMLLDISVQVGNVLKMPTTLDGSEGKGIVLHSYLHTIPCQFSISVQIIMMIWRSNEVTVTVIIEFIMLIFASRIGFSTPST